MSFWPKECFVVVHFTTAHPRYDVRIFRKELESLPDFGISPKLIVADGLKNELAGSIEILDIGKASGRFERIFFKPYQMLMLLLKQKAKIFHFHDPELIFVGAILSMTGRIVVYDSHEDAPLAITAKRWIWKPFRWIVAASFRSLENTVAKRLAGIVAATSKISERFLEINSNVEIINNFPIHREFLGINAQDRQTDEKKICYIGALSEGRGIFEMVSAMENIDATLILAGKFDTPELEKKVKDLKGWQKVDFRGYVGRAEIRTILSECTIGFLLLHPEPNYVESQPIKLFEYMMAGVAVVASDFSYWKDHLINDKLACFVDPTNLTQIVSVVNDLLKDDHARINMVGLSRRWAAERFSWETESKKLVEFYKKIVNAYS